MTNFLKSILGILVLIITIGILSGGNAQAGGICPLLELPNGSVVPSGQIDEGNSVDFFCDDGFELVGASSLTCQGDETYDGNPPTCEPFMSGCDDEQFFFWERRLCNKYCEKLDCDGEWPRFSFLKLFVCHWIEHRFIRLTGIEPPCEPPPPVGACCIDDIPNCVEESEAECDLEPSGGDYQGDETTCETATCSPS